MAVRSRICQTPWAPTALVISSCNDMTRASLRLISEMLVDGFGFDIAYVLQRAIKNAYKNPLSEWINWSNIGQSQAERQAWILF